MPAQHLDVVDTEDEPRIGLGQKAGVDQLDRKVGNQLALRPRFGRQPVENEQRGDPPCPCEVEQLERRSIGVPSDRRDEEAEVGEHQSVGSRGGRGFRGQLDRRSVDEGQVLRERVVADDYVGSGADLVGDPAHELGPVAGGVVAVSPEHTVARGGPEHPGRRHPVLRQRVQDGRLSYT